jgi:hypothetical protein
MAAKKQLKDVALKAAMRDKLEDEARGCEELAARDLDMAAELLRAGGDPERVESYVSEAIFRIGEARGLRNALADLMEELP